MKRFEWPQGYVDIDPNGDICIHQDGNRVFVHASEFREFFESIDAARDDVMPPGPLEIPDPVRHEEAYAKVNAALRETIDPNEVRRAHGYLSLAIGNLLNPGRRCLAS